MSNLEKWLDAPVYMGKQVYTSHKGFGHNWAQRAAANRANEHVGEPIYLPRWMVLLGIAIVFAGLWFFCIAAPQMYVP